MTEPTPIRKIPRAPAGLGARGSALWRDVLSNYELRVDEIRTLEAAARLMDELATMQNELAMQPVIVDGSRKQQRPNPLFSEARNHRIALQKLLTALALPDLDADASQRDARRRSHHGRAMAMARWGQRNG